MPLTPKVSAMVANFANASGGAFAPSFIQLNPSAQQIAFIVAQIQPQIDAIDAAIADIENYKQARLDSLNAQKADLQQALAEIQALGVA